MNAANRERAWTKASAALHAIGKLRAETCKARDEWIDVEQPNDNSRDMVARFGIRITAIEDVGEALGFTFEEILRASIGKCATYSLVTPHSEDARGGCK